MTTPPLPLSALTVTFRDAPVDVRAPLALGSSDVDDALARWRARGATGLVLSTCQRTELYFRTDAPPAATIAATFAGRDACTLDRALATSTVLTGEAVLRHLVCVAAGLDSSALGESEVLGQVRRAVLQARCAGTLDGLTSRMADTALRTGKRVRSETALAARSASLVTMAMTEASRRLNGLAGRRVVVLGSGHVAGLVLREVRAHAASDVQVVSRTWTHAAAAATRYHVRATPWEWRGHAIAAADVVVCCAGAAQPLVTSGMIDRARAWRAVTAGQGPVFVDLAVPRGLARRPHVAEDGDIIDLDALHANHPRGSALSTAVSDAEAIVDHEVARFVRWWRDRGALGPAPCGSAARSSLSHPCPPRARTARIRFSAFGPPTES